MSTRDALPIALAGLALAGCVASTQRVALDCIPERAEIFVDGRLLEQPADELFLRTDEPHKIYVKGPGYTPQLVVIDSLRDAEGRPQLDRDRVCVELVPVGQRRELELEAEEPGAAR